MKMNQKPQITVVGIYANIFYNNNNKYERCFPVSYALFPTNSFFEVLYSHYYKQDTALAMKKKE